MISMRKILFGFILVMMLMITSCYSFKGLSIPDSTKSYYIHPVQVAALDAPIGIGTTFQEALRRKVQSLTSLSRTDIDPQTEFITSVVSYTISTVAATDDRTVSLNKITISVKAQYINNVSEGESWTKTYSQSIPFDASTDINTSQDEFIDDIFNQITDQIINDAYAQW